MTFTITLDPERPIDPFYWPLDVLAASVCLASITFLMVVFVLLVAFRRRPGVQLMGGARVAIAPVGGALHLVATLVTNAYLPALETARTATCWLWDYGFTTIGFGLFFGSIASGYLSARTARFASATKVGAGLELEEEAQEMSDALLGDGGSSTGETKAARKRRRKAERKRKEEQRNKWRILPVQIYPTVSTGRYTLDATVEAAAEEAKPLFQIDDSSDDDESEDRSSEDAAEAPAEKPAAEEAQEAEQVEVPAEEGEDASDANWEVEVEAGAVPEEDAEISEEEDEEDYSEFEEHQPIEADSDVPEEGAGLRMSTISLDDEAARPQVLGRKPENVETVPRAGERRVTLGKRVFILRPGCLVAGLIGLFGSFTRKSARTQRRIIDVLVWTMVLVPAAILCVGSLIPGVTEWKDEDSSCYTYYPYKLLVLSYLFCLYVSVSSMIVAFFVTDRRPVVPYRASLDVARRNLRVPRQTLSASSVDDGFLYADGGDGESIAGGIANSIVSRLKTIALRLLAFAATLGGCCGLVLRVRYVGPKASTDTVLLNHDRELSKTLAECYTSVTPRSGYGHSRRSGGGGGGLVLTAYMRVQYAGAIAVFACGMLVLVPLNMVGWEAVVYGRFVYAVIISAIYVIGILLIAGTVLFDIVFRRSRRIKAGLLKVEAAQGTPCEPRTVFVGERPDIIQHFAAFLLKYRDDTSLIRRLRSGHFEIQRVSPGMLVRELNDDEAILFTDRMALLMMAGFNAELLNIWMTEAYSGDGYGSIRRRLLDPQQLYTNMSAIKSESVFDSRYRTAAVPEMVFETLFELFNQRVNGRIESGKPVVGIQTVSLFTSVVAHEVAFYILAAIYWRPFVAWRKTIEELNGMISGANVGQPRDRKGASAIQVINFGELGGSYV